MSDYRSEDGELVGNDLLKYEDGREHNILIGNIFDRNVYKEIDNIVNDEKVNLILERMVAGFRNVPNSTMVIMAVLQKWYSMLSEEGLMLIEVLVFLTEVTERWVKILKSDYDEVLDVEFDLGQGALRIQKLPDAPKKLPVLKLEEINEIINKNEAQDSPINN